MRTGYDLPLIRAIKDAASAEVVASGGAGELEHFYEAIQAGATILLAASVFHFGLISIPALKNYLKGKGRQARLNLAVGVSGDVVLVVCRARRVQLWSRRKCK